MTAMVLRVVVLTLALVASACGGSDDSSVADALVDDDSTTSTTAPSADADSAESDETASPTVSETTSSTTTTEAPLVEDDTAADVIAPASLEPDCEAVGRPAVGLQTGTFTSGDVEYTYQWTVPSGYTGEPIPVVLDFHGIGSNGAQQAVFAGWAAKAEAEGFLAIQPTGISVPGDDRASWELPQFELPIRDDIRMVLDLIDLAAANVCIDPARIYATGMSNGGFFTSEIVCDLSNRIAAAVSVAGVTHHGSCNPSRAVPYLAFHGTADTVVPFSGGGESTLAGAGDEQEFFEQVMPAEFAEFAADFGCQNPTDTDITAEVKLTSWSECDDEVEVGFYTISGAGHTWPGSQISAAITSLGVTNLDVDATALSWEFFSRHSLSAE